MSWGQVSHSVILGASGQYQLDGSKLRKPELLGVKEVDGSILGLVWFSRSESLAREMISTLELDKESNSLKLAALGSSFVSDQVFLDWLSDLEGRLAQGEFPGSFLELCSSQPNRCESFFAAEGSSASTFWALSDDGVLVTNTGASVAAPALLEFPTGTTEIEAFDIVDNLWRDEGSRAPKACQF